VKVAGNDEQKCQRPCKNGLCCSDMQFTLRLKVSQRASVGTPLTLHDTASKEEKLPQKNSENILNFFEIILLCTIDFSLTYSAPQHIGLPTPCPRPHSDKCRL